MSFPVCPEELQKGVLLEQLSDTQLVEYAQRGHHAAFGVLFQRHFSHVRSICRAVIKDGAIADDIAQEAFLRGFERIDCFDPHHRSVTFKGWIDTIAFRLAVNRSRRRSRETVMMNVATKTAISYSDELVTPMATAADAELRDALMEAIHELPEPMQGCVRAHYLLGLSYEDICVIYGLTKNQVTYMLCSARRTLSQRLKGHL